MNLPRDREHDLDRLLDDEGGELGALYRRLPRVEPPRRLDRNVLGQAARAVRGKTPRRHRWLVGFGSAAGVVLAAGIAWRIGQEALPQPSPRSAPQVIPVQPIAEPAQRRHERAADAYPPIVVPQAAAPAAAPEPQPAPAAAKPASPQAAAAPKSRAVAPAAEKAPAPLAAPPPPPAPAPAPFAAETETQAPVPANAPAAVSAEAPESKTLDATEPDRATATRVRAAAPPSPSTSVELRRDMQLAPQDWLAHIRQLLHQGRRQQAIESLRLFRRAHPDWQLSAELEALSR